MALAKTIGQAEESDTQVLEQLCLAAEQALEGRLKEGLTSSDCQPAFALGAAWLALSGLRGAQEINGVEGFTAGELTVRMGNSTQEGNRLRQQAEQIMKPYLKDESFAFVGVRG